MRKLLILAVAPILLSCTVAYADGCVNLDKNEDYIEGFEKMATAIKAKNYREALTYANALTDICSKAPKLNYIISKIYKAMGDEQRSLFYLQVATRNLREYEVESDLMESMWRERIYAEHPEASPEAVAKLNEDIEGLKNDIMDLKEKNAKLEMQLDVSRNSDEGNLEALRSSRDTWKALTWTGAGITAAGLALTITGAVMVTTMDSPIRYDTQSTIGDKQVYNAKIDSQYATAWALLGAGIAATAVGGALTGIAGYKYVKSESLAVSLSPTGFVISGSF